MSQVVDDAEQTDQRPVWCPPGLLVTQSLDLADHGTTKEPQPAQEQFPLVAGATREVGLSVGGHHDNLRGSPVVPVGPC